MSKDLVESIIDDNLVAAKDIFESRMEEILECKLYENKKMMQAQLDEIVKPSKTRPGEFEGQNTSKDWARYRKQHPAMGMYDSPTGKVKKPESKVEKKRKAGHTQAYPTIKALEFIQKVKKYKETGKLDEIAIGPMAGQAVRTSKEIPAGPAPAPNLAKAQKVQGKKTDYTKTAVKDTETPAMDMSKIKGEVPYRMDVSKMGAKGRTGAIKQLPKSLYKKDSESAQLARIKQTAERLKQRGHADPYGKVRSWRNKKTLSTLGAGLSIIKRGLEHIGNT